MLSSDADYVLAGAALNSDPRNSESSYHRWKNYIFRQIFSSLIHMWQKYKTHIHASSVKESGLSNGCEAFAGVTWIQQRWNNPKYSLRTAILHFISIFHSFFNITHSMALQTEKENDPNFIHVTELCLSFAGRYCTYGQKSNSYSTGKTPLVYDYIWYKAAKGRLADRNCE